MKAIKLFLLISILILSFSIINANNINLNINENLDVNELGGGQVEITAIGILQIENPTNNSLIYEYDFTFNNDFNFQVILNSSNVSYKNNKIKGKELNPKEKKEISYKLKGIIPKTKYNNFYQTKTTLFEYYIDYIDFSPLKFATLNKLDKLNKIENGTFERYILIEGKNPSEFDVEILYLDLYKTQSSNNLSKIMESQNLLETYKNISLIPNQSFHFKAKDKHSNDKTTYWIEYDIVTKINLTSKLILNYYHKGGNSNKPESNKDENNENIITEIPLIFKKESNKDILSFTDDLLISLNIKNPNNNEIKNILIIDEINEYFDLLNVDYENTAITKNKLNFVIKEMKPYETKIINYNIKFNKITQTPILYFSPAKLSYRNENIYSNSLNIINDLKTQDKRIFIQKEIEYLNSTTNRIYIKVKNIGEVDFTNLVIVENEGEIIIESNLDAIQKNKWTIPKLNKGDEWTTYYDVPAENVNKYIPEIYGADDAKIYKTIILNEKIDTLPIQDNKNKYQIIIVGIAIVLLIVDIVF